MAIRGGFEHFKENILVYLDKDEAFMLSNITIEVEHMGLRYITLSFVGGYKITVYETKDIIYNRRFRISWERREEYEKTLLLLEELIKGSLWL